MYGRDMTASELRHSSAASAWWAWLYAALGWCGIVLTSAHFHYAWSTQLVIILIGVPIGFAFPGKPGGVSRRRAASVALVAMAAGFVASVLLRDASSSVHDGIMAAVFALMFGQGARLIRETQTRSAQS